MIRRRRDPYLPLYSEQAENAKNSAHRYPNLIDPARR